MTGKGSTRRPTDHEAFSAAFDRIFGKPGTLKEDEFMRKALNIGQVFTDAGWTPMQDGWKDISDEQLKSPGNER